MIVEVTQILVHFDENDTRVRHIVDTNKVIIYMIDENINIVSNDKQIAT